MHEWKKNEKAYYLPKSVPEIITIPEFKFFQIEGQGNPNDNFFADYVSVLYSLSYAVKMSPKSGIAPEGYFDYSVYPLEGIWDISEKAKENWTGELDKNTFTFELMIRQPEFVTEEFAQEIINITKKKKPSVLLSEVKYSVVEDGKSVQMMHLGSYDNEPESFRQMEDYCKKNNLTRESKQHREIYLSDARKVTQEKLKTVLRIRVKHNE